MDAFTQLRYNLAGNLTMPVICIANQKGGVGKTTTTAALADGLSEHHKRVLLIDWDPQASLTISLEITPDNLKLTGYDVLTSFIRNNGRYSPRDVALKTANPN